MENLPGGMLHPGQTREDYVANISDYSDCKHPAEEIFCSRCLVCGEKVMQSKRSGETFYKDKKKKK